MAAIERRVGASLFERLTEPQPGVRLTPLGEVAARYARRILRPGSLPGRISPTIRGSTEGLALRLHQADEVAGPTDLGKALARQGYPAHGSITLLTDDGDIGKSLLIQQLMTVLSLGGQRWLGIELPPDPIVSLGIFCEDEESKLWRR